MRDAFARGTRIRVALDARERPMHCHHEKLVIVDGEVAFVGGIDLTVVRRRPARQRASTRLAARSAGTTPPTRITRPGRRGRRRALPRSAGARSRASSSPSRRTAGDRRDVELQIVRTVPEKIYDALPRGEFSILESYLARSPLGRAAHLPREPVPLVARDRRRCSPTSCGTRPTSASACSCCCRRNRTTDATTRAASSDASRPPPRPRRSASSRARSISAASDAQPVYVHAKIGIVDDRWLTIGSANLNEHSLFNDTEVNVVCADPATRARDARFASGASTSSATRPSSRATRPSSSTSSGGRSPRSSCACSKPAGPHAPARRAARRLPPRRRAARPAQRPARRRLGDSPRRARAARSRRRRSPPARRSRRRTAAAPPSARRRVRPLRRAARTCIAQLVLAPGRDERRQRDRAAHAPVEARAAPRSRPRRSA